MLHPSFGREQSNDTLDALRMAPVSSFAIVLGKMLANFIFLSVVEVISFRYSRFFIMFRWRVLWAAWRSCSLLGTVGLVITGTVFSAISAHARMRELLLPLLLLPLLAPLLIAAVEATASLFADQPGARPHLARFPGGFDIVFFTASWLLSDFLIEE